MSLSAEEIFFEAWELPVEMREAFLEEACAGDEAVRREVERLMVDAGRAENFFGDAPTIAAHPAHVGGSRIEKAGDWVGAYRLVEEIGQGGFGVVWRAEQSVPISREVAVKVIKAGMDTREVLSRFQAERQALARMDHSNIARVLDAGETVSGRPFVVMELVRGEPITSYCDARRLDGMARLRLFAEVCHAISHAHQKGVIHRDIKPSNVLVATVDDAPVVKVIDFGIAKAVEGKLTEFTLVTQTQQFVGTPAYMSPEQAGLGNLDIDTRTDIYALGVLLYELLAGAPPFDPRTISRSGYDEARRVIREVDPPRPSERFAALPAKERLAAARARGESMAALRRFLASELDWIVMKALEKSRSERYTTADAFAEDVARFLADEPVSARPPTTRYLLSKFARRHRGALQVLLLVGVILVAATAVSSWQAVRARQAEIRAHALLQDAETERNAKARALEETKQAEARAQSLLRDAEAGRNAKAKALEVTKQAEARAQSLLRDAEAARNAKERALQDSQAVSNLLVDVFRLPSPTSDSRTITVAEALKKANEKLDRALDTQPERRALLKEALAETNVGLGLYVEATELRKQALALYTQSLGEENATTLDVMGKLVSLLTLRGFYEEAWELGQKQVALRTRVNGAEAKETRDAKQLLEENALRSGKVARPTPTPAQTPPPATPPPPGPKSADIQENNSARRELAGRENWVKQIRAEHKADAPEVLGALSDLAADYYNKGFKREAVRVQTELVDLVKAKYGETHRITFRELENLAFFLERNAQWTPSFELRKKTIELRKKAFGPDDEDTLAAEAQQLQVLYWRPGSLDDALALGEDIVPRLERVEGMAAGDTLFAQGYLGRTLIAKGRPWEALRVLEQCAPYRMDDTFLNMSLASLELGLGQVDAYRKTRDRMINNWVSAQNSMRSRPDMLERMVQMACLAPFDNRAQGLKLLTTLDRCRVIRSLPNGPEKLDKEPDLFVQGVAHFRLGDYEKALALLDKVPGGHPAQVARDDDIARDFVRAVCLLKLGRDSEARVLFDQTAKKMLPAPSQKIPESSRSDGVPFTMAGNLYDEFKKSFAP
jgi:serine/threonine protein kinase/tetratricopeptide (TPR) repeat protein